MRDILFLGKDLVVAAFYKMLLKRDWYSDEYIIVLLRNWDQLNLSVVLSNFVIGQEIHQIKTHYSVHFLRIRNETTELLIIVSF